jgi:hypothetical protein
VRELDATVAQLYLPAANPVVLARAGLTATVEAAIEAGQGTRFEGQGRLDQVVLRRRDADAPLVTAPSLVFSVAGGDAPARLDRLEVTGTATVFDQRSRPPRRYAIDRVRLRVDDVRGGGAAPGRLSLTAGLPGGGDVDVQGTARFAPFSAELRARMRRLDLGVWTPLLPIEGRLGGGAAARPPAGSSSPTPTGRS